MIYANNSLFQSTLIDLSTRKQIAYVLYAVHLTLDKNPRNFDQRIISLIESIETYLNHAAKINLTSVYDLSYFALNYLSYPYLHDQCLQLNDNYLRYITHYVNGTSVHRMYCYLDALTKNLPKTPFTDPLEIIVYLQDQELYPILNGNRLNLWDKDYEYQITGTPQEIANTLGIRNLLNAITSGDNDNA